MVDAVWSSVRDSGRISQDVLLADGVSVIKRDGLEFVVIDVPRADRGEKPVEIYDRRTKKFIAYVRRGRGDYKATAADVDGMRYDKTSEADRKPLDGYSLGPSVRKRCDATGASFPVSSLPVPGIRIRKKTSSTILVLRQRVMTGFFTQREPVSWPLATSTKLRTISRSFSWIIDRRLPRTSVGTTVSAPRVVTGVEIWSTST